MLEEILDDIEHETSVEWLHGSAWKKHHKTALKHSWNFTNFKKFISKFLHRKYTEDQWVMDYTIYVESLSKEFQHPGEWAEFHYQKDWDTEKIFNKLTKELVNFR